MRHRLQVAAGTAAIVVGFMALAGGAAAADASVSIDNLAFSPATVVVQEGDTVTWTNEQTDVPHTVTADGGSFASGTLATGDTFQHTFTTAGTFAYHCTIHPTMLGTVEVQAAQASTTTTSPGATTTPSGGGTPTTTDDTLARTGSSTGPLTAAGIAAIGLGTLLVAASRRRAQ